MSKRIAFLAGSLSSPSKTRALIELAAERAASRFAVGVAGYDLTDLQPSLGQAVTWHDLSPLVRSIVENLITADALIIGSPVYKGSYTGLFKHLFDLIEPNALAAKPILLTATGGGDKHALVVEHQLRPLFGFFEAATLPTAVYASSADFTDGRPSSTVLLTRLDRAVEQFAPWLDSPARMAVAAA